MNHLWLLIMMRRKFHWVLLTFHGSLMVLFKRWKWKCCPKFAVTTPFDVVESASFLIATLAQKVELYTLTQVCILAKNKTARFMLIVDILSESFMILDYCGSNMGFCTSRRNKIKTGPMFWNHFIQWFFISRFGYYWFCGILKLTFYKLKEIILLIFLQGIMSLKEPTTTRPLLQSKGIFPQMIF